MRGLTRRLQQALALLLVAQLGTICGLLLSRQRRPPPSPPATIAGAAPAAEPEDELRATITTTGTAPARAQAASLLVDVLDGAGAPQRAVVVLAQPVDERGRPTGAPEGLLPVGELGVLKGRLPLAGEVISGSAAPREHVTAVAQRAQTDERGTARLSGLRPGRYQLLCNHLGLTAAVEVVVGREASAPESALAHVVLRLGLAPASLAGPALPGLPGGPEEPSPPILGAVRDLSGVVLDERGLGLARARIEAQGGEGHRQRRSAISDSAGRFTVIAAPAGAVTLLVQHPGFAPLTVTPDEEALRAPLRLQLSPGAGVEGLVRERRLGGLPEGVRLTLHAGGLNLPIAIGRDGRFLSTGLPVGEAQLRAEAPGYVPLSRRLQLPGGDRPEAVTLRDLVLDMELGGTLAGQLRDSRGPAARTAVRVLDEHGAEVGRAQSDGDGRFRIGALPPGGLRVEARGAAGRAEERVEVRSGDESKVELELRE